MFCLLVSLALTTQIDIAPLPPGSNVTVQKEFIGPKAPAVLPAAPLPVAPPSEPQVPSLAPAPPIQNVVPPKPVIVNNPPTRIRWWIYNDPPGFNRAQMQEIVREAARKWSIANLEIRPALRPEEANVFINAEQGDIGWIGFTDYSHPHLLRRGHKVKMRINSNHLLDRRGLLSNICHELGHALGLGHGHWGSVMEPSLRGTVELSPADRAEIMRLYPH
jgi:hypothetical protein